LDAVGCSFALLRRVCWPALEECYESILQEVSANDAAGRPATATTGG
jgi:hypothetical protein